MKQRISYPKTEPAEIEDISVYNRINFLMGHYNIKQVDLANCAGLPASYISRVAKNKYDNVYLVNAFRIYAAFKQLSGDDKLTFDWVFGHTPYFTGGLE